MPERTEERPTSPRSTMPSSAPQQSSSVPSTPPQHARDSPFTGRPPSPSNRRASTSPSSAKSESTRMSNLRRGTLGNECRYMTTQTSRRRIAYSIGSDLLDPPRDPPQHHQNPEQHRRLSKNIDHLFESLLPSEPSQDTRNRILDKLRKIISNGLSDKGFDVHIFGSSGNMLFTDMSDVDICVTMRDLESTCVLAELLAKNGMKNVKCVHAKSVPIVKIWDPELNLNCDLNLNNHVALKNTNLVRTYIELDDRVRPLAMIIKHWTKRRIINEASGGTLSSYTWTLLLINFLQTRDPPVLPCLSVLDSDGRQRSDFREDLQAFRDYGRPNNDTVAQLLFGFFRRYSYEIDFEDAVISVREARLLSKRAKGWDRTNNNRLCVEEPFNTERNLANTADDFAWRGLHYELRRAFHSIAEAHDIDHGAAEQFEFPPNPKPSIGRQLPQSKPPTLTRSLSQSGRGGRGAQSLRGNRSHLGRDPQRNPGSSNRRASSAAAFGHTPFPLMYSSGQPGLPLEYLAPQSSPHQSHGKSDIGMHEHLTQLSRQLSAQEQHLRQRLASQSSATGQVRPNYGQALQQPRPSSLNGYQTYDRNGNNEEAPATAPLPQVGYPFLQWTGSQMTNGWSPSMQNGRGGTDTNPSSPSQTPLQIRRGAQRGQLPAMPSTRSQSQPARSPILPNVNLPSMPLGAEHGRQIPSSTQQLPTANQIVGHIQGANGQYYYVVDPSRESSVPMEYLGYGFRNTPYYLPPLTSQNLAQLPSHMDWRSQPWQPPMQQRQPSTTPATAGPSRSPSPLRESMSTIYGGYRTAPLPQDSFRPNDGNHYPPRPSEPISPLMTNGSYPNVRSLGHDLNNSARPRRVSDSVGYSQNSATAWQPNGASYAQGGAFETSMNSSQELGPLPISTINGQAAGSEAAETDDGQDPFVASNKASSTCHSETGPSPALSAQASFAKSPLASGYSPLPPSAIDHPRQQGAETTPLTNGRKPVPALDISGSLPDRVKDDEAPLTAQKILSPVQETRTPSPTPNRLSRDLNDLSRLNGSNGIHISPRPRQLPDPPTPLRNSVAKENQIGDRVMTPGSSANSWQQVGKKTHKKGKSTSEMDMVRPKGGQPMPADISQRKGG